MAVTTPNPTEPFPGVTQRHPQPRQLPRLAWLPSADQARASHFRISHRRRATPRATSESTASPTSGTCSTCQWSAWSSRQYSDPFPSFLATEVIAQQKGENACNDRRNDHPELPSPFLALFFDVVLPALEFVRSPRKNCDSYLDLAERADRILPALQLGHLQDEGVKSGPQFRDGLSCLPLLSPDPLHLLAEGGDLAGERCNEIRKLVESVSEVFPGQLTPRCGLRGAGGAPCGTGAARGHPTAVTGAPACERETPFPRDRRRQRPNQKGSRS